jgi:hypothetical protein
VRFISLSSGIGGENDQRLPEFGRLDRARPDVEVGGCLVEARGAVGPVNPVGQDQEN